MRPPAASGLCGHLSGICKPNDCQRAAITGGQPGSPLLLLKSAATVRAAYPRSPDGLPVSSPLNWLARLRTENSGQIGGLFKVGIATT